MNQKKENDMLKFFPVILMVLMFLSGCAYLYEGDYRKVIYWWAAVALNASVTF